MGQCLHQAQTDHISSSLVGRHGPTHIAHRCLNAAGDDFGGVKQGAIPVEGYQVKVALLHTCIVTRTDCQSAAKSTRLARYRVLQTPG